MNQWVKHLIEILNGKLNTHRFLKLYPRYFLYNLDYDITRRQRTVI